MKIDIVNLDRFIALNNIKEVSNPILMKRDNIATEDGLLSTEIFGRTTGEKTTLWGYIDLKGHFLHPHLYSTWKRLDRKIEGIVAGTLYVNVVDGELVKDENGWTGLEALYSHYDKIHFKDNKSQSQQAYVNNFRAMKKNEIFITKWLVCPLHFRDSNMVANGQVAVHEITDMYANILRLSKTIDNDSSGLAIIGNVTRSRMQDYIQTMYKDIFVKRFARKNGLFRKSVMGKSIDYGARLVITATQFNAKGLDKPTDMKEDFCYAGTPLATVAVTLFPFVKFWIRNYLNNEIIGRASAYPIYDKKLGKIKFVKITNADDFTDDYIDKQLNIYIRSYADRFNTIELKTDDPSNPTVKLFIGGTYTDVEDMDKPSSTFNRPMTWTDLIYRAAVDASRDRHIVVTRYPLEDYFGVFICKINVSSTMETCAVNISGTDYPDYPVIDLSLPKEDIGMIFRDSLAVSNLYMDIIGGDFDGDQVTVRGLFTDEANAAAHRKIYSKSNLLGIDGSFVRKIIKEGIQCIYSLTTDNG